jgi:Rad3-related DNA helicase
MEGHRLVVARRGAGYRSEVPLSGRHGALLVRGRADGYDPQARRLEEIKTHRGRLDRLPDKHRALHWAQAEVYAHLLCEQDDLAELTLALVYLDLGSQRETVLTRRATRAELQALFARRCEAFVAWAEQELAQRQARDAELSALTFPEPSWRAGQRELAAAVYRASKGARCLLAQAPTGIGKTLGTIFPALTALPRAGLDRLFFLTAKTSGRALALGALARLRPGAPSLRVIELVARDKACEHPELACHGASCPLARGFYDRLPQARRAAAERLPVWDKPAVRQLAAEHHICPYYLGQELSRWADVAVGDYNHWFDGASALLHGQTQAQGWKVALLVDEAHNLIDRARGMYSADFEPGRLGALRKRVPAALKRPLGAVLKRWDALLTDWPGHWQRLDQPPDALIEALLRLQSALLDHLGEHPGEHLGEHSGTAPGDGAASPATAHAAANARTRATASVSSPHAPATHSDLQAALFDTLALTRLATSFGDHSWYELGGSAERPRLTLRNVLPAPFIAPRLAAAHGVTLFSATLQPHDYHRRMLGLPADTVCIDLPTPFDPSRLQVAIAPQISTRYADRAASLPALTRLIAQRCTDHPGNYIAYFSSFEYLEQAAEALARGWPELTLWRQTRGMSEAEQAAWLQRFVVGGQGLGLAVLGGAFAEGIDLPGERLHGAFIATLGLPQFNPETEAMRERLDTLIQTEGRRSRSTGYDYTYLYPGLQKVVQAAGRVIRSPEDRGVLLLMDDRYGRREVRELLPAWWVVNKVPVSPS